MPKTNKKFKTEKRTSIGGQAVLEGVMMRGKSSMATAVRDEKGNILTEAKRLKNTKTKSRIFRIPVIRGVYAFIQSLFGGMSVLMRSAEVYGEAEPTKFEKWLSEKLKIDVMSVVGGLGLILGLLLAVFLFIWLPQFVRTTLEGLFNVEFGLWAKNFIEGGLKLLVFLSYIVLVSLMKDIRRTFMYHGAEHKTISCYEKGLDLNVENVKTCPRVHDRCGTTFIVFVMLIGILIFAGFEALVGQSVNGVLRVVCKLLLLPIVAGLSYELLKALSKTTCWVVYPLKVPGLLLQRITTREPDEKMIEVAITAFKKVLEMDADESIPECEFEISKKRSVVTKIVYEKLKKAGIDEKAESEWIVSLTLGVKRDQVYSSDLVNAKDIKKIEEITVNRCSGRPLWYCIGDTEFYGYTIKVDERVLIPRPETELLVENALKYINRDSKVLDLCTGSGAIAVSVQKQSNAKVCASDISTGAIEVAIENAKINDATVEFIKSDLFDGLSGKEFDVIISNPPYIKTEDIIGLQKEVKSFEPNLALDGGVDGLDFYRKIAKECKNYLTDNGVILLECGYNQARKIKELFNGFSRVEIIKDYENIERIIVAVV